MEFNITSSIENIFIFGAGASVDYGLPIWRDLAHKIREKIAKDNADSYKYKKQILGWLEKIGDKKQYSTLDECVFHESVSKDHHLDGVEVENEVFSIIKEIFNDSYREGTLGWIRKLNDKILDGSTPRLERSSVFVNYNYDHVLDDNFLNYEYLSAKHKRLTYKGRLAYLSTIFINTLYPHGTLFPTYEKRSSHIYKSFDTIKTGDAELLDAVSCYEGKFHKIDDSATNSPRRLYIMGLGGGLIINLGRLNFGIPISEIHVTIKDKALTSSIISFLAEKFKMTPGEIKIYNSCEDLIDACF